jgi:hypothetical protein
VRFKKFGIAALAVFAAGCGSGETISPKIITSTATVTSTVTSLPPVPEGTLTPFALDLKEQSKRLMDPYKERVLFLTYPGNATGYNIADYICRSLKVGITPNEINIKFLNDYGSLGSDIILRTSVKHFCIDQANKVSI